MSVVCVAMHNFKTELENSGLLPHYWFATTYFRENQDMIAHYLQVLKKGKSEIDIPTDLKARAKYYEVKAVVDICLKRYMQDPSNFALLEEFI